MSGHQTINKFFGNFAVRNISTKLSLSHSTPSSARKHRNSSSLEQYDLNTAIKMKQGIILADIYKEIIEMCKENNDCRKSIEFLSNKFDNLIKTVSEVKAENVDLKKYVMNIIKKNNRE